MKHLKSSLRDLHEVFDRGIMVRHLAEPLVSFDSSRAVTDVRAFMAKHDFDVVGVRHDGRVVGFVQQRDLDRGTLDDYLRQFDDGFVLDESASLLKVLDILGTSPRVFVLILGQVSGIVTKGDLQKAPLRMWLFGLLSLLEMQFLRLIRNAHPEDSWAELISESRLEQAKRILEDRHRRNEAIDLADCLQFADKRCIIAKTDRLRAELGFDSRDSANREIKDLEHLRDELMHAQDIVSSQWPNLVRLAYAAEKLLERCEKLQA